jgi:alkaline phosphatase
VLHRLIIQRNITVIEPIGRIVAYVENDWDEALWTPPDRHYAVTLDQSGVRHFSSSRVIQTTATTCEIKGETLIETARAATPAQVAAIASLEDQHTAEEVPVIADGPGAERVHGFMPNTEIFHIIMSAFGWE